MEEAQKSRGEAVAAEFYNLYVGMKVKQLTYVHNLDSTICAHKFTALSVQFCSRKCNYVRMGKVEKTENIQLSRKCRAFTGNYKTEKYMCMGLISPIRYRPSLRKHALDSLSNQPYTKEIN